MAKKAAKGEATRTETLTMRLSPKIKYGLELLARKQHRTLAGVAEWAFEKVLDDPKDGFHTVFRSASEDDFDLETGEPKETVEYTNTVNDIWSPDEVIRYINLAFAYRHLLTFEEEALWVIIENNGYYWVECQKTETEVAWDISSRSSLQIQYIKDDWESLKQIVESKMKAQELPVYWPANRFEMSLRWRKTENQLKGF